MGVKRATGQATVQTVKRRRRRLLLGQWIVIGLLILVGGRIAFSWGYNLMMLAHEAREYRRSISSLRAEVERIRQQNETLEREIDHLRTRSGIILEARKQGYGFPGEKLLVLDPSSNSASP